MDQITEVQFVDADTGAHLVTVKGDNAQVLLEQSELLQTVAEFKNQPNPRVLVVPIGGFPADRRILFVNILNGVPIGRRGYWGEVAFYPLGPEEEKDIKAAVNAQMKRGNGGAPASNNAAVRERLANEERRKAVVETLQYLLVPDTLMNKMIVLDEPENNSVPRFNVEDMIEEDIKDHMKFLFLTNQKDKLTPEQIEIAKEFFEAKEKAYKKGMNTLHRLMDENAKRRATRRRSRGFRGNRRFVSPWYNYNTNSNNNDGDYYHDQMTEVEDSYIDETNPETYEPKAPGAGTENMTVREYERFLRTEYYKKAPLPQNALHLNMLFNENKRALRNRVNRPTVIYMNNNNNGTRKRNNKKTNKAPTGKNAW